MEKKENYESEEHEEHEEHEEDEQHEQHEQHEHEHECNHRYVFPEEGTEEYNENITFMNILKEHMPQHIRECTEEVRMQWLQHMLIHFREDLKREEEHTKFYAQYKEKIRQNYKHLHPSKKLNLYFFSMKDIDYSIKIS